MDAKIYLNFIKRYLDLLGVFILFVSFSWLFIVIIIAYLITLEFPVFFIQKRIGKNDKPFDLIKFRTLSSNHRPLKERQFWLGKTMRFFSLDELPQLINVLKGEMSFIGPRPLPPEYLPLYSVEQRKRHTVKPGITGWAQVNGRHAITWNKKFELDLYYIEHVSFWLDLKIVIKTIIILFSFKRDMSLNEERFMGSNR